MRPGNPNNRRQRGRPNNNNNNNNNNRRPQHSRNQTFDSNGPGVRIRGNAAQIYDKYIALARDATSAGDRVLAENLLQHAEHYFRILNADNEQAAERRRMMAMEEEQEMEQAFLEETGQSGSNSAGNSDNGDDDDDQGDDRPAPRASRQSNDVEDLSAMPGFLTQGTTERARDGQGEEAQGDGEGGEEERPRRRGRPLGSRRRRRPADDQASGELPLSGESDQVAD
jgi:hypothetical protein